MNEQQTRDTIKQAIEDLYSGNISQKIEALFQTLGYSTERKFDLASNDPKNFLNTFGFGEVDQERAMFWEWKSVDFLFQLTEAEIRANPQRKLFNSQIDRNYLQSYIFLSVGLRGNVYTRTQLANITRAINRQSDIPIMVLFRYGEYFSFSIINRRPDQRERSQDVLQKITLIKDVVIAHPDHAHLEILFDLSLKQLYKKYQFANFDQLHDAWQKTLDISELNNKFFNELANWYFWAIEHVKFPDRAEKDESMRNSVSIIRLITRLIFVWFLVEKGLIERSLFNDKITDLYRYENYFINSSNDLNLFEEIPFLNGGLFECLDQRVEEKCVNIDIRIDGFSDNSRYAAVVPNFLFFSEEQDIDLNHAYGTRNKKYKVRGLIHIFNRYKFTITENTPIEQEIALDPELLGKVFESLLASYNEETQTRARKKTGFFYIPREIVNYMVDESLIIYLETKLTNKHDSEEQRKNLNQRLRHLCSYTENSHQFSDPEVIRLIVAIDSLNFLDPACGSGAFPMGILHKLVFILGKIDPHNEGWKQQQKEREIQPLLQNMQTAEKISYELAREQAIQQLQEKLQEIDQNFAKNEMNYPRKLCLIKNCIYGVDIQPIAVEITKLRFLISLIVDQKIDRGQPNRDILPLPNLDTNFIAANALLPIKIQLTLNSQTVFDQQAALAEVRRKYFTACTQKTQQKYCERDQKLREEVCELLKNLGLDGAIAETLTQWNPYDQNTSAKFFDPEWMFGLSNGFDIIISNPPYVSQAKIKELKPALKEAYYCYTGTAELYVYFYERAYQLLNSGGVLSYISPNKYFRSSYGEKLRDFLGEQTKIHQLIDFGDVPVFKAIAYPSIIILSKEQPNQETRTRVFSWEKSQSLNEFPEIVTAQSFLIPQSELKPDGWRLESIPVLKLVEKLRTSGTPLGEYVNGRFYRGILTGFNEAFVVDSATRDRLIAEHPSSAEILKPFLRGQDVKRWRVEYQDLWLIVTRRGIDITKYPAIEKYLNQFKTRLMPGIQGERKAGSYKWYEIHDNIVYWEEFEKPKIIIPAIMENAEYAADFLGYYSDDKTSICVVENVLYILGILNSRLMWWFIQKTTATKQGDFYELKPMYVSKIPIIKSNNLEIIEILVDYIIYLTAQLKDIPSHGEKMVEKAEDKLMLSYFEQIVDALVMELYLPEELHSYDKYFMRHILAENLPKLDKITDDKISALRQIFKRLFDKEHPIRVSIYFLNSLEVVRIIRGLS